jgi:dCTP deaminase
LAQGLVSRNLLMLSAKGLVDRLSRSQSAHDRMLSIVPAPDLKSLESNGAASLDLRLGRWFRTLRPSRTHLLDISLPGEQNAPEEARLTKEHFVPFGQKFVLHPRTFTLGITLEWLRLPHDLGGYITGKSSLGRRGLVIETAAGLQPGFSGCLALELSNVGEVPLALVPGMLVCQVFLHTVENPASPAKSQFSGRRKPVLGSVHEDDILARLKR